MQLWSSMQAQGGRAAAAVALPLSCQEDSGLAGQQYQDCRPAPLPASALSCHGNSSWQDGFCPRPAAACVSTQSLSSQAPLVAMAFCFLPLRRHIAATSHGPLDLLVEFQLLHGPRLLLPRAPGGAVELHAVLRGLHPSKGRAAKCGAPPCTPRAPTPSPQTCDVRSSRLRGKRWRTVALTLNARCSWRAVMTLATTRRQHSAASIRALLLHKRRLHIGHARAQPRSSK